MKEIELQTHRYLFSHNIVECLIEFAILHQHDDKKTFKSHWNEWIIEKKELIEQEKQEYIELGFEGSPDEIENRLYTSCRYYYLKQIVKNNNTTTITKIRKPYEKLPKEKLTEIDNFIREEIGNELYIINKNDKTINTISPSLCFQNYLDYYGFDETDKLKKTFKNRFYVIRKMSLSI